MTTAKRMLLIIVASWILPIAAGVFSPQSRADLRKSVWGCLTGKPATTGPRDPPLGGMDIYIQYCGGWGYGYAKKAKQLKEKLEEAFNGQIVGRYMRDPGTTGNFEVVVNGEKVWSKKNGQGFPSTEEKVETIIAAIKYRIKQVNSPTTTRIKPTIAGLDIHIQYCGGWGYGPKSKLLKKQLEEAFDGQVLVRETRDPGVTGNFEVFVNGENVWSKKNGQGFPDTQEKVETIIAAIKYRIKQVNSPTTTRIKPTIAGPDIHIQYCGGWGYGRQSSRLKSQLEEAFDGQVSVRETRDPGVTGNFEVFVDGDLVWSKRTWGQDFPTTKAEVDTICDEIRDRQNGRA